ALRASYESPPVAGARFKAGPVARIRLTLRILPFREIYRMNKEDIKATVKAYILNEFLPGEDPAALTDTTPLVSTGILDSVALLNVVTFLETQFGIMLDAHKTDVDHINTLDDIPRLVPPKKS